MKNGKGNETVKRRKGGPSGRGLERSSRTQGRTARERGKGVVNVPGTFGQGEYAGKKTPVGGREEKRGGEKDVVRKKC